MSASSPSIPSEWGVFTRATTTLVDGDVHPGGEVVLHLDDSCGEHFLDGHWPAVRFGVDGTVLGVTVKA